jgi:hypothetical protein
MVGRTLKDDTKAELVPTDSNTPEQPQTIDKQSPMGMLMAAAAQNIDPAQVEKYLDMQERWEAREARKAFVKAMAAFKANPPKIVKDQHVSFNTTNYKHASLGNVMEKINAALSGHGLTVNWFNSQDGQNITVTCRITHAMGHYEETSMTAPPDNSGKKNNIQQIASTITYLERYTALSLCGLATYDDDGQGVSFTPMSDQHLSQIRDLLNGLGYTEEELMGGFVSTFSNAVTLEEVDDSHASKIINSLKQSKPRAGK